MRIVGGTVRGRTLETPQNHEIIRPTADRVRETIFNVLGQTCEGLEVLDLFCGTGALAFEALSRGASRAVLVDSGKEAQKLVKTNAESLGFAGQIEFLAMPALRGIHHLAAQKRRFEVVFSDPPYKQKATVDVLSALTTVLSEGGVAVVEYSKHEAVPDEVGELRRVDERTFGETVVSMFRR